MHVGCDYPSSHTAALIASTPDSSDFHWLGSFDYLLKLETEMGNRRSYCKLEIFRRLLFMIKGFHIGWHSFKLVFCKLRFIKECVENSMFNCSKHGFAYILVFFTEWLVNNPNSAVSVDRKAYQNSDCWQVSFNKI